LYGCYRSYKGEGEGEEEEESIPERGELKKKHSSESREGVGK